MKIVRSLKKHSSLIYFFFFFLKNAAAVEAHTFKINLFEPKKNCARMKANDFICFQQKVTFPMMFFFLIDILSVG